jgi:hypothetical protein
VEVVLCPVVRVACQLRRGVPVAKLGEQLALRDGSAG